jgi:hypothetical protein
MLPSSDLKGMTSKFGASQAFATINTFKSFRPCNHCRLSCPSVKIRDLCCCAAEVLARIPSLNASEGVQKGAEGMSLAEELMALC